MFPIFSTAVAIIICLTGFTLKSGGSDIEMILSVVVMLSIIPIGEALVRLCKFKPNIFSGKLLSIALFVFTAWPLISFGTAVFLFGWARFPHYLNLDGVVLLDKALVIASYIAVSSTSRIFRDRFYRAVLNSSSNDNMSGLVLALRGELTVVIPFIVFMLFYDLIAINDRVQDLFNNITALFWASLLFLFFLLAYCMPMIIKIVWNLKPLPEDSMERKALIGFLNEQDFKARDILVWNTGRRMVNAAILGLTGKTRYIIFTDAMLQSFTINELKSVMAHEIGHGKCKHLLAYFLFSIAFIFSLSLLESTVSPFADIDEELYTFFFIVVPAALVYWRLVFSLLSKRFEMEADIYGAAAVDDPDLFIYTLNKVAIVGRVAKRKSSWRHFSIERRILSLRRVFFDNPMEAVRFWLKMKRLRISLFIISIVLLAMFCSKTYVDTIGGAGCLALKNFDYPVAEARLKKASSLPWGSIYKKDLFELFLKSDKLNLASSTIEELTRSMKPNEAPGQIGNYYFTLVLAYIEKDEKDGCFLALDRVTRLFPDDKDIAELNRLTRRYFSGDRQSLRSWLNMKNRSAKIGDNEESPLQKWFFNPSKNR